MVRCCASSVCHMPRCIGVSVEPGDTRLQRTPNGAISNPTQWFRLVSAALEAQAAICARGTCAALEPMLTIARCAAP